MNLNKGDNHPFICNVSNNFNRNGIVIIKDVVSGVGVQTCRTNRNLESLEYTLCTADVFVATGKFTFTRFRAYDVNKTQIAINHAIEDDLCGIMESIQDYDYDNFYEIKVRAIFQDVGYAINRLINQMSFIKKVGFVLNEDTLIKYNLIMGLLSNYINLIEDYDENFQKLAFTSGDADKYLSIWNQWY